MVLESTLTRDLAITFIDARHLTVQAKISLGIDGYPTNDQGEMVIQRAIELFEDQPVEIQQRMKRNKTALDDIVSGGNSLPSISPPMGRKHRKQGSPRPFFKKTSSRKLINSNV